LCFDTEVRAGFREGDLDLPVANEQRDDFGGLDGGVCTEEGLLNLG
jgi:hypothetical protein